mmetsp:Transcript_5625/g.16066  ORF Transcript_5625/g.16066 Transcript_5625/m.16066 type:complete len:204 (+) Transcript_5625:3061-3672(+)
MSTSSFHYKFIPFLISAFTLALPSRFVKLPAPCHHCFGSNRRESVLKISASERGARVLQAHLCIANGNGAKVSKFRWCCSPEDCAVVRLLRKQSSQQRLGWSFVQREKLAWASITPLPLPGVVACNTLSDLGRKFSSSLLLAGFAGVSDSAWHMRGPIEVASGFDLLANGAPLLGRMHLRREWHFYKGLPSQTLRLPGAIAAF